jgi:hypothetical protein
MIMVRLEGLGKLKEFNNHVEIRSLALPACRIASSPSTLPCAHNDEDNVPLSAVNYMSERYLFLKK